MPDKPLLIFPIPSSIARYKLSGGNPKPLNLPSKEKQVERIQPILNDLENSIKSRRVSMQSDVTGVEPEMVLVFETKEPVDEFFKAVRKVPELEWLGEMENEFLQDEFFNYTDSDKSIRGKIFFVLTDYTALKKIIKLWNNFKFTRKFDLGTTKWRDVFKLLHDIRPWGVKDRIAETGILEDWTLRMQDEQNIIPIEIELWYRKNTALRSKAKEQIQKLLDQFDGKLISESIIGEISYHGLLINAPIQLLAHLNENTDVDFFKSDDIMYFRPVGQCAVKKTTYETVDIPIPPQPELNLSQPIVALFDGMPLQNHSLLGNRIIIDDPDDFANGYLTTSRYHGTGMASIIIHNDLNVVGNAIRSSLYIRPIMKSKRTHFGDVEYIPENVLIVDLIHIAVRRLFEKIEDVEPISPKIKIINLSIGDPYRVLDNIMSSWAKLIDWLSFKYNVLFIISAGNCSNHFDFTGNATPFAQLIGNATLLQDESIKLIYNDNRHRKIISPAESINSLTVGSTDHDELNYQIPNDQKCIFQSDSKISPLSRMGLGYRRSIKPEVLAAGGRAIFRKRIGEDALSYVQTYAQPGIKVAAPSNNGLNGIVYSSGTSNSAATLSHLAAKLHENLVDSEFDEIITDSYFALVAKSLLVHSASWDSDSMNQILQSLNLSNINPKDVVARFLGYGNIHPKRIFECTDKRVTLIGHGAITAESGHQFNLPIPVVISGSTLWRSLTVTLAWFTPVNPLNQAYRQAKLWFDFPEKAHQNILNISRKFYDNDTVNRGTVQHEIFEGVRASAFLDGTELPIRVNCKSDAPGLSGELEIKYVLCVTLEVDPNLPSDIYNDIELRIRPRVIV